MAAAIESRSMYKNRILASLQRAEIMRLAPHLLPLDLPSGKTLLDPGQEITYAYFLETGLASVVVAMANGNMVETGITGNDGVVGFSSIAGHQSHANPHVYADRGQRFQDQSTASCGRV